MRRTAILILILIWATLIDAGAVFDARADAFPTVAYRLVEGSTFQEGCFDPCDCLIIDEQPMTGTMDLVFYPFAGPLWRVAVERVDWTVPTLDKHLAGQGDYVRAGDNQQMRLDVQIDGEPARAFDSGLVGGGVAYPAIDLTLSMNGLYCYDIALHVRAEPVPDGPHLVLDGRQLTWNAMSDAAAYDVVCGDLDALGAGAGDFAASVSACLADGTTDTTLTDDQPVAPGQVLWFLVRPQAGSYDSGMPGQAAPRDAAIASSPFACP